MSGVLGWLIGEIGAVGSCDLRDHGFAGQSERGADIGAVVVRPRFHEEIETAGVGWRIPVDDFMAFLFESLDHGFDGSSDGWMEGDCSIVTEDCEG